MRALPPPYVVDVKFIVGDCFLGRARDHLVQFAIDTAADILVWIDSDGYWTPADFLKIISSEHDYIGGLQRLKQFEPKVPVRLLPNSVADASGVMQIRGIGFGMTKMSRKCFTTLHEQGASYVSEGQPRRRIFETLLIDGDFVGEDFSTCDKWTALGGTVWADTSVKLGHVGYSTEFDFVGLDDPHD